jgi:hypothetical protein
MRCSRVVVACALLTVDLLTARPIVSAQRPNTSGSVEAWAPFLGRWNGPGTAMGTPATGDAQWAVVLGGRFVRLEMSFTPTGAPAPVFFGHAYYSTVDSTGAWIDSQGTRYDLRYGIRGDTLSVRYTLVSGAHAESRYVRTGRDTLEERSASRRSDGTWNEFLNYRFTRRSAAP